MFLPCSVRSKHTGGSVDITLLFRTDPLISKTFLARLCEQAERYDGKTHTDLDDSVIGSLLTLDSSRTRNGYLHEGQFEFHDVDSRGHRR